MTTPLDIQYFEWLRSQIGFPSRKSYNDLFELMHNWEFIWTVPNDDNRRQDGLDLRSEFLNGTDDHLNLNIVTILEVLVGLSRRVAFTAGRDPGYWAWQLIKNLRLHKSSDPLEGVSATRVNNVLGDLVYRLYDSDGRGGFFPLQNPKEDQTKVEIWYQMQAYVIEMQNP